jgi:hypothetical protein
MSRQLLHCSRSKNAIMASSTPGVRNVCGRPAFTSNIGITLPVSWKRWPNLRSISASERRRPGQRRVYSSAAVPGRLLLAPRVKSMWQHSSCVHCMIISLQMNPAVHCGFSIYLGTPCTVMKNNTNKHVTPFDVVYVSKTTCPSAFCGMSVYIWIFQ